MASQFENPSIVFVVDDDEAMRCSLKELIESMNLAVRCFSSADEFISNFEATSPGCIILDERMPGMSGSELQERLAADEVPLPIIMITGHGDIPMSVRALKKGAINFLEKPFDPSQLMASIKEAIECSVKEREEQSKRASVEASLALLTPAERQVMNGLLEDKLIKVIASDLDVSLRTVEFRWASIRKKLNVDSRASLAMLVASAPKSVAATEPPEAANNQ